MKSIAFSALCALALLAFPACSDNENSEPRLAATAKMTETFALVADKESADNAAKEFRAFSARLDQLPPTTPNAKKDAEFAVGKLFSQIARLKKNDYFGSKDLENAIYGAPVPAPEPGK